MGQTDPTRVSASAFTSLSHAAGEPAAEPALAADREDNSEPAWENAWIDLGGEG